jgi:putative transposase
MYIKRRDERITYGRTCAYNLNYHIVWETTYRNKVLNGTVEEDLKRLMYDIAREKGFEITHLEIGLDDHVHLMVSAPPKLSVTTIVSCLKGTSAFRLFRLHPELKQYDWKKEDRHLWSSSCFLASIGTSNEKSVAKYIDDQRRKENGDANFKRI